MTNKDTVRKIDPAASAQPGRVLESFPVRVDIWRIVGYDGTEHGFGNTEDAAWLDAAVRLRASTLYEAAPVKQETTAEVLVNAILVGCASGELDPGDSYPGARANRPNALKEHVESEVDYLLSRFRAQPTR